MRKLDLSCLFNTYGLFSWCPVGWDGLIPTTMSLTLPNFYNSTPIRMFKDLE